MQPRLLVLLGAGLVGCHQAPPIVTTQPLSSDTTDSLRYQITVEYPTYAVVLATAPGQPIRRLTPVAPDAVLPLQPGVNTLTLPALRPYLVNGLGSAQTSRIDTPTGYLDQPGSAPSSTTTPHVVWEDTPSTSGRLVRMAIVLVLLPGPVLGREIDQALPALGAPSAGATVRALQDGLGVPTALPWVVLASQPRRAI